MITPPRRSAIVETPPNGMEIIAWNGQSNAAGTFPRPDGDLLAGERTYMFTLGGKWVTPAFEPSQTTEHEFGGSSYPGLYPPGQRRGSSAAVYFLDRWAELNPMCKSALVNIACRGSRIAQHLPPRPVYQAGRAQLLKARKYGRIAAFVWIQGESDAASLDLASTWAAHFVRLTTVWRSEFGANIPIVVAQLGDPVWQDRWPHWNVVKQQQELAVTVIPNATLVRTAGLKKELVDGVEGPHYTDDSFRTLGEKIALALYALKTRRTEPSDGAAERERRPINDLKNDS